MLDIRHITRALAGAALASAGIISVGASARAQTDTSLARPARADSLRRTPAAKDSNQPRRDSSAARTYGGVPMKKYGDVPMKKYGDVPMKIPSDMPIKKAVDARSVVADSLSADSLSADSLSTDPDTARTPPPTAASAQPSKQSGAANAARWTASYYYVDSLNLLHTWDFLADGTYLYREVYNAGTMSHGTSERGTYVINGNVLEVHVTRVTTASGVTVHGTTTMSSGVTGPGTVRRYQVRMLGPQGESGIVLDGIMLKRKSW